LQVFGCYICSCAKGNKVKVGFQTCVKCIFIGYCEVHIVKPIYKYVIINHDVIFYESKNFNCGTIVSKLDYG